ncbi:hypothetical protein BH11MYX2_BH11MYX2_19490 [soil metagenome]
MTFSSRLLLATVASSLLFAADASAWSIGSQLDYKGCHERINAQALRNVRAMFATAPTIKPSRDEAAVIDSVQFEPPADFVPDLAAMTLLIGVRDNDLKGNNPLDGLRLVQVHGNPETQEEHCIRAATDDGDIGNETALVACRSFIVERATEALAGLDANGVVDSDIRLPLAVFVSFAGHIDPKLPLFWVRMGQAVHAVEDGFTHTYRTEDGSQVTVVTNWIDNVTGHASEERRDGPIHLAPMDDCDSSDPLVKRNYALAVAAATEFLAAALDPSLSREQKIAAFEALTIKHYSYMPGCTIDNNYCDAPEPHVAAAGCDAAGGERGGRLLLLFVGLATCFAMRRRRVGAAAVTLIVLAMPVAVHAQPAQPAPAPSAPAPAPSDPAAPVVPTKGPDAPAVPVTPREPGDLKDARQGKEPGRDEKTPTKQELRSVREDKRLGNPLGFNAMVGGSIVHGAAAIALGVRYRISEKWIVGGDAELNPWFTSVPLSAKWGSANFYGTLIRRFPMAFDRVNLRTSLHLGISTLLFDVYGAPKGSVGPYISFTPLGIDYDLGGSVRLVIDPVEISCPVPHIGPLPLYYEQFRLMIGLQIGA